MKNRWVKNVIITLVCITVVAFTAFFIDYLRLTVEKPPLLSIKVKENEYSKTYLGLGYKVYYTRTQGTVLYFWDFFGDFEPYDSDNVIYSLNYR